MVKSKKLSVLNFLQKNLLLLGLLILLLILISTAYQLFLADKFYPFTYVGDANVSFLTKGQAIKSVQSKFQSRARQKLDFNFAQGSYSIDLATSSAALDYSSLDSAFTISRSGNWRNQLKKQLQSLLFSAVISPEIDLSLDKQLNAVSQAADKAPSNAELIFDETPASSTQRDEPTQEGIASAHIQIKEAVNGLAVDQNQIKQQAVNFLLTGKYQPNLPLKITSPQVSTTRVAKAKEVLEYSMTHPLKLVFGTSSWILDTKQLLTLIDLETNQNTLLNKDRTYIYLKNIAGEIDQNVQEGLFDFNPATKRVIAFKPSQEGRRLNRDKAYQIVVDSLASQGETLEPITLPVETVKPKIATSDVNHLGIKELLGRGISNFAGSITNRIFNIELTAAKINGVLIPPGEIFSFNQTVGDISAATGFKQAYVIKEGRTVLDDGGGVCQVSTTLFRAVLNSGLPVVKRTAHAYRVSYYEQGFPPGLDATVFQPAVDFQFKNDTARHILLQAYTSGATLYVDLYGAADGRGVSLTQPVVTNQTPPPPDLKQDDPTLPKDTVKQVDWPAWGATVTFKRIVTRGGETFIEESWKSVYKPWQAVYLVGTKEN